MGLNVAEDDAATRSMLALSFISWKVHRLCVWNADENDEVAVEIGRNSACRKYQYPLESPSEAGRNQEEHGR